MYIFSGPESFLPEFELHGGIELREADVEVALQCLWVADVDTVVCARVLLGRCEMLAESLCEPAELCLSGVLEAELESL